MIKLLNAGFTRLRKNKVFWLLNLFSIVFALFVVYASYADMTEYGDLIEVGQLIIDYATIVGILIAIFTSLFLGVEYSDGTMRNKICIGHKRTNIYLSNLILVAISSLFSYILYMLVISIVGIPLFGKISIQFALLLKLIGCIFIMILSYSSIFTFIAMLISNKTITAVTSILLAFCFMMGALICLRILETPEFFKETTFIDGEMKSEEVRNPKYPSESKKKLCQTLLDINPAGQGFQIAGRTIPNIKVLPLYSLGIFVVFTGVGVLLFKKKELK